MYSLKVLAREAKISRVAALTDGVLAIVMTLLVIDLVSEVPNLLKAGPLTLALLEMWPKFVAYALSFIMLGILWSYHHHMFQRIKHVDPKVLWINLLLLMFVALVPFSTSMLGEFKIFDNTAVVFYGSNFLLLIIGAAILWSYVSKNRKLLNDDISPEEISQFRMNAILSSSILAVAIGLSFINSYIGIMIYILLALWGIIGLVTSKIYKPESEKSK